MTLPNLIGCGAGKSGTTSLYYYLNQHPAIYMATAKEVHYFSRYFENGIDWYTRQFEDAGNVPVIGEFSTSYMMDSAVPARMAAVAPNAKLLFIFRNPIKRAYSNYWFSISIGTQNTRESFSEAIRTSNGHKKYIVTGYYMQHLNRFLEFYSREQIHIMITERLQKDAHHQMSLCYQFLQVDPAFVPDLEGSFNTTVVPTSPWQAVGYRMWLKFKDKLKPSLSRLSGDTRKRLATIEYTIRDRIMSHERPPMSAEDRAYLADTFAEQNQRLAEFLGSPTIWEGSQGSSTENFTLSMASA